MILLIDLDGTVRDVYTHYIGFARITAPDIVWPIEGPRDYWFLEPLKTHPRITQLENLWFKRGLFEYAMPYKGAVQRIKAMAEDYAIFFVTEPKQDSDTAAAENVKWVRSWFGTEWETRLIQTYDRTIIDADFLIDDKPSIIGLQPYPSWKHIVYSQPYNKHIVDKFHLMGWDLGSVNCLKGELQNVG